MHGRHLPDNDYRLLKAVFRTLLRQAGGPNHVARTVARVDASRLSRYASADDALYAPLDVIADLEAETGDPIVTRTLADLAGFVLVPKSAIEKPIETVDKAIGPVTHTVGTVMVKIGVALEDGIVTPEEAAEIEPCVREAEAEIVELREALHARAQKAVRS